MSPNIQDRKSQASSEELLEFPIIGPFGGTQSELPLSAIESFGFADSTNVLFRKGVAYSRPGFTALTAFPAPANENVVGIADFFNASGAHVQCVLTPTRLLQWNSGSSTWTNITGPGFTGGTTQVFVWDVLGYKLCFSQGADKVFTWDGIAGSYVLSSANAVACNAMAEVDLHLVVGNTLEAGVAFPQRYRWTGAGDPTDWTSFNAGVNDQLTNLGPIQSIAKLGQYGYGWHYNGIVQIIPTGVGTAPFYFLPIINASIGAIASRSVDHFDRDGQEQAAYTALDNVYIFNQSSVVPIGDRPIDGHRRVGARSRILGDLKSAGIQNAFGFVTNSINGQTFNAYWLILPNVSVWVYNFDEENWTPFSYSTQLLTAGNFQKGGVPRIMDLVGTILQQNWTPANLVSSLPFPGFALGFTGGTVGYVDFTNSSELGCQIVSSKHTFGDRRHLHTIKKFRLVVQDQGSVTYTIKIQNERGTSQTKTVTLGNGSGDDLSQVIEFNITGLRLQWTVSAPANQPAAFVEFCPIYTTGGEQRGGSADGN